MGRDGEWVHPAEKPPNSHSLAHRLLPAYLPSRKNSSKEVDETQQEHRRQAVCILQALWTGEGARQGQQTCRAVGPGAIQEMGALGWQGETGRSHLKETGLVLSVVTLCQGFSGGHSPSLGSL